MTPLPPFKPYLSIPKHSLQLFHLSFSAGFEPLHSQFQVKHSDRSAVYAIKVDFSVMSKYFLIRYPKGFRKLPQHSIFDLLASEQYVIQA